MTIRFAIVVFILIASNFGFCYINLRNARISYTSNNNVWSASYRLLNNPLKDGIDIAYKQTERTNASSAKLQGSPYKKKRHFVTKTFRRLNESRSMEDIMEPLLDTKFLQSVINEWARPIPAHYLLMPLVLVGPSGVGKNRLINLLLKDYSKFFERAVTYTTRNPRPNEINGTHYHFISLESFQHLNSTLRSSEVSFFVETAIVHNNSYGLAYHAWNDIHKRGKICIMEVDIQGALSLRKLQKSLNIKPNYLFLAPPSIESLEIRLLERGTESSEQIQLRLTNAVKEIEIAKSVSFFRAFITNEDIAQTGDTLFRCLRDWYPLLPAVSKVRMLQRRIKVIKERLVTETLSPDSTLS